MRNVVFVAAMLCALPAAARAQSAVPFGSWSTGSGNETLVVSSGYCRFASGRTLIEGTCSWNSSYGGGILTIMNVHQFRPAPIRENIVWVNRTTIRVWGDVFYLRR